EISRPVHPRAKWAETRSLLPSLFDGKMTKIESESKVPKIETRWIAQADFGESTCADFPDGVIEREGGIASIGSGRIGDRPSMQSNHTSGDENYSGVPEDSTEE